MSTYFQKKGIIPYMRNNKTDVASGDPKIVNGILRWKAKEPTKGSVRDSSVFRKFHKIDNIKEKIKYIKRWTNSTILMRKSDKPKTILYFNDFAKNNEYYFGEGMEPFIKADCPFSNCFATSNRTLVKPQDADAIIWHPRAFFNLTLPEKISPHTRLVFFIMESPTRYDLLLYKYSYTFNYTMSYSYHADIFNPYGQFIAKKTPNNDSKIINHASGKTKLAVWFVSNCNTKSRRENLVDALTEYIDVEIYGHCGPNKCRKEMNMNPENCFRNIEKKYKFYFSFENSLCKNYVSEKFFRAAKYDMVPVVYGVGPYDTIAPPKSYIDVFDFKNLKELADYLLYLDKNDTAYNEYFDWKNYYESSCEFRKFKPPSYNKISWCQLCEKLNTDFTPQTYTQMGPYHGPKNHCLNADTPVLKKFIGGT